VTPVSSGQIVYEGPTNSVFTTYSFVVPAGITSISVVAVAAGGRSSEGSGNLAYGNNISVTPGETLTVYTPGSNQVASSVEIAKISRGATVLVSAGSRGQANSGTNLSGGGLGRTGNGSGAGGYSGQGGAAGNAGVGGAGGGGGNGGQYDASPPPYDYAWKAGGGGGGGVGLLGQGSNGVAGSAGVPSFSNTTGGGGGGGGSDGSNGTAGGIANGTNGGNAGNGGQYGASAGAPGYTFTYVSGSLTYVAYGTEAAGAKGAVRIIWPGNTRLFPSTNTGDL
jgi:hypothetical protein